MLLYQSKRFFQSASVHFTLDSAALAESFWSRTEDCETWGCVFFLVDLDPVDIGIQASTR